MQSNIFELQIKPKQRQIYAKIDTRGLDEDESLPDKALAEIRLEIAKLKSAGRIEEFNVYEQELRATWTKMLKKPQILNVLVADGYPKLTGLECNIVNKTEANIHFSPSRFIAKNWQPEWITAFLSFHLRGTAIQPESASLELQYYWAKFIYGGQLTESFSISANKRKPIVGDKSQPILHLDQERGAVFVKFASALSCQLEAFASKRLFHHIIAGLRTLSFRKGASGFYAARRKYLRQQLEQLPFSEARLGNNLPKILLAGVVVSCDADQETAIIPGLPFGYLELVCTAIYNLMKRSDAVFSQDFLSLHLSDFGLSNDTVETAMQHLKKRHFIVQLKSGMWQANPAIRWRGARASGFPITNFDLACTQFHTTRIQTQIARSSISDVVAIPEALVPVIADLCESARLEICNLADNACADPFLLILGFNLIPLTKQTRTTSQLHEPCGIDSRKYATDCSQLIEFLRVHLAPNHDFEWVNSQWLAPLPTSGKWLQHSSREGSDQRVAIFNAQFLSEVSLSALSNLDADRAVCVNIVINISKTLLPKVDDILQSLRAKILSAVRKSSVANQLYAFQVSGLPRL